MSCRMLESEEVVIIAGKDRSRTDKVKSGKVTSINRVKSTITVEGLNISKKAVILALIWRTLLPVTTIKNHIVAAPEANNRMGDT